MKFIKVVGLSVAAGIAATLAPVGTVALAQEQVTLDQVLRAIRREGTEVSAENREREQRFVADRNNQRAELARARQQVAAAEAESTRLETLRDTNAQSIAALDEELADKQGEFQELFGAARSAAAELTAEVSTSQISAQFPGRADELREVAQTETLPTETQLRYLWTTYVQQIAEQGKVATFNAEVAQANGTTQTAEITRIGPFVAFSNKRFLTYDGAQNQLEFLAKQPAGNITGLAGNVENASGDGFVRGVIDPSLGTLLSLVVETPSALERLAQGRTVGYAIVVIAIIGALLGVYKWVTLSMIASAVKGQVRKQRASKGNPLGRVMLAYEAAQSKDVETVALKLDDAILKEIPRLEGGLNLIKVFAAVAPLMGLLGTVIGMINTFQAITLFGTGDPQIMAGGISEALVTTVLGLIAAIPLLLLHAFASGASKRVSQILEEQAAGIVAEHAEGRA
ncbi:MAG: MotA/TolQ/ExbB proton channel family protein [Alphaproteobacteria bacterium]|nr:MotA/TolQ/ExbB proton channel family protein [Alphaproteobacteria bacterium]